MISRDYTREIGNRSASPLVPLPIAIALLALGGAGLWFGVSQARAIPSTRPAAEESKPAVAGKPAPHAHGSRR